SFGQRPDELLCRAQELPVRVGDPLLRRECAHRLVGVEGLVEADADDVELVRTQQHVEATYRVVQGPRLGRADLEAAGVDEAHQQGLAAIARQGDWPARAIDQRGIGDHAADGRLAHPQRLRLVERRYRSWRARALAGPLDEAGGRGWTRISSSG